MKNNKVVNFDDLDNLRKEDVDGLYVDNSYSPNISFWSDDNIVVGILSFGNGVLKFEGNADESAKVFLNAIGRQLGVPLELLEKIEAK